MKPFIYNQRFWHGCMAFLLLPVINLSALFYVDIFYQNQSYIGNELHHPLYLMIWGSCNAFYFFTMTRACLKQYFCLPSSVNLFLFLLCMSMITSVLLPYDPQTYPTISQWHVRLAMFGSVGYALFIFCFLFYAFIYGYGQIRPYFLFYVLLCFISLYGFALHGAVTSFTEITYSMGMGIFLYHLRYHRDRQK